ncbi:MAG: MFS transporter [Promethearchaeota archaeon]|jgi:Na+/melibiose symporter-like transporter
MSESEKKEKLDVKLTFFIGLAFFTTGISWSMYNTQVNITLFQYLASYALVGAWMAMDNLIGVIIQPIMGSISDNTRTKFGRRIPYLLVGIPLAAIFFVIISTINPLQDPMWLLLLWMFFFNISMASYRSQAVALMPDFVKPSNRSKGNAIINFMGGIGAVMAYVFNLVLVPISLFLAFLVVAIIMVISLVIVVFTVKETDSYSYKLILEIEEKEGEKRKDKKEKRGIIASFKDVISEGDKSTLFILFAIFFWFVGYQALEALFTVYGVDVLGLTRGGAGGMLLYVALSFLLFAFPAGILGTKIGRKLTIKIGLILWIVSLIIMFIFQTVTVISIFFVVCGAGWAFININSIVIVWEMAPTAKKIGTYTGLYYFFSFLAAILGPFLVGLITDALGNQTLFLVSSFFYILAIIFVFLVKKGEVELTEEEKSARQKTIQEL